MMFLPKRLPRFSKRKAQVAMDFSKHGNRQLCKNVFVSSGSLQSFNGLERQFEQRQDVVQFVPFLGGVVYFNTEGQVCYQNGERLVILVQNTSKCTLYVCKRSNRCFVSFDLGTYLFNGTNNLLATDLHFVAFQNFAERVFAVTGDNVLYFSAVNNPTVWTVEGGGGNVTLDGNVCSLAVCNNKLYAIGQNVYVLSTDDSLQNWKIKKTAQCFNLQGKSVCTVNDCVVYASHNLFLLKNGIVAKMLPFEGKFSFQNSVATAYGKWYVATCQNVKTGTPSLLFVDVAKGDYWQMDVPASKVLAHQGTLFVVCQNQVYSLSAPQNISTWVSNGVDFGDASQSKCLQSVSIKTNHPIVLRVVADDCTRDYNVPSGNKVQTFPIRGVAKSFVFCLISNGQTDVESLAFSAVVATPREVTYGNQ